MTKKEINVKLKDYKGLKEDFTQVANYMQDYIEDPYTFSVYFYLCRTYNKYYGYSFPSIKTISEKTHMSEGRVKKSLKWLIDRKFIIRKHLKNGENVSRPKVNKKMIARLCRAFFMHCSIFNHYCSA